MKTKIFIVFFLVTFLLKASAATVNLNVGDVITLQPNTMTTVSCGSSSGDVCRLSIANFETKLSICKDQLNTIEDCLLEFWPSFKRTHSSCIEEAYPVCVKFCRSSPLNLDCLTLCK